MTPDEIRKLANGIDGTGVITQLGPQGHLQVLQTMFLGEIAAQLAALSAKITLMEPTPAAAGESSAESLQEDRFGSGSRTIGEAHKKKPSR